MVIEKMTPNIVSSDQYFAEYQRLWPHLVRIRFIKPALYVKGNFALADGHYITPTLKEVQEFLDRTRVPYRPYIKEVGDCDNFAGAVHEQSKYLRWGLAEVGLLDEWSAREWTLNAGWWHMISGKSTNHAVNSVWTTEGVMVIEPQIERTEKYMAGNMRPADPAKDIPYFIYC